MNTFGPLIAPDPRTMRPLAGRPANVVDGVTGESLPTFDMDDNPAPVVTNAFGWAPPFRAEARIVLVRLPGGDPIPLVAREVQAEPIDGALTISTTPPAGGLWINPDEEA